MDLKKNLRWCGLWGMITIFIKRSLEFEGWAGWRRRVFRGAACPRQLNIIWVTRKWAKCGSRITSIANRTKPRLTTTAVTVMTCYNKFAFIFNVPHLLSHSHSGDEIKKRKNEKGSSQRLIFNKIVVPSHDNIEVKRRWWRNIENWLYYAIFVLFHVENSNTIKLLEIKTPDTLWDLTRQLLEPAILQHLELNI